MATVYALYRYAPGPGIGAAAEFMVRADFELPDGLEDLALAQAPDAMRDVLTIMREAAQQEAVKKGQRAVRLLREGTD